jgi:hypothetical protein
MHHRRLRAGATNQAGHDVPVPPTVHALVPEGLTSSAASKTECRHAVMARAANGANNVILRMGQSPCVSSL